MSIHLEIFKKYGPYLNSDFVTSASSPKTHKLFLWNILLVWFLCDFSCLFLWLLFNDVYFFYYSLCFTKEYLLWSRKAQEFLI